MANKDREILKLDWKKKDEDYCAYIKALSDDLQDLIKDEKNRIEYIG